MILKYHYTTDKKEYVNFGCKVDVSTIKHPRIVNFDGFSGSTGE